MKPNTQNHHYINGHWMKGRGKPFASTNPVDNSTLWQGTQATEDEVAGAFEAARNALPAWALSFYYGRSTAIRWLLAAVTLSSADSNGLGCKVSGAPPTRIMRRPFPTALS